MPNSNGPGIARVEGRRFAADHICPVCGGHDSMPEGAGVRCFGFLSRDGVSAYCTREDFAGGIAMNWGSPTFAHPLSGPCPCGRFHTDPPPAKQAEAFDDVEPPTQVFDVEEPAPWLVVDHLLQGGTSLLVGKPGSGKSRLAQRLALSVARGDSWAGFESAQGRVLWVDLERSGDDPHTAFSKQGLTSTDDIYLFSAEAVPGVLKRIGDRALQLRPALIVIRGLKPLLNSEEWMQFGSGDWIDCEGTSALDRVLDLAALSGAHLMLLHHLGSREAQEMGQLLGSTGREIQTILAPAAPDPEESDLEEPLLIPIRRPQQALASGRMQPRRAQQHAQRDRVGEQILAYLWTSGRAVTQVEIVASVNARKSRILEALRLFREDGRVVQLGEGIKGSPFLYTGCDPVRQRTEASWLRRVRTWTKIPTHAEENHPS